MNSNAVWAVAFGIGVVAGLRSMTAPAVVSWFAQRHLPALAGTPLAFMASMPAAIVLTLGALAELVTDKLPKTPSRTKPVPFIARLVTGALSGATLATGSGASAAIGAILGAVGGLVGTWVGYLARTRSAKALSAPDFVIALTEDAIAVGGALFLVTRL
jgi:uncharacterized membrane protein